MSEHTGIEWTDATWNPVTGSTKVSPGCDHHQQASDLFYLDNGLDDLRDLVTELAASTEAQS